MSSLPGQAPTPTPVFNPAMFVRSSPTASTGGPSPELPMIEQNFQTYSHLINSHNLLNYMQPLHQLSLNTQQTPPSNNRPTPKIQIARPSEQIEEENNQSQSELTFEFLLEFYNKYKDIVPFCRCETDFTYALEEFKNKNHPNNYAAHIVYLNVANKAIKRFQLNEGDENHGNEIEKANALYWLMKALKMKTTDKHARKFFSKRFSALLATKKHQEKEKMQAEQEGISLYQYRQRRKLVNQVKKKRKRNTEQPTDDLATDQPTDDLTNDQPTDDLITDYLATDQVTDHLATDQSTDHLATDQPTDHLATDQPTDHLATDQPTDESSIYLKNVYPPKIKKGDIAAVAWETELGFCEVCEEIEEGEMKTVDLKQIKMKDGVLMLTWKRKVWSLSSNFLLGTVELDADNKVVDLQHHVEHYQAYYEKYLVFHPSSEDEDVRE
ncbi:uncharacterized protein [Clytia hemisphaerica]|uniref:uncharacterized protein n=1 Tax=Clytia hemisphaerica TaxID=252671 RepID=UPI0034D4D10F